VLSLVDTDTVLPGPLTMPTCFPSVATSPFCGAPWTWWKLLRIARSRRGVVAEAESPLIGFVVYDVRGR